MRSRYTAYVRRDEDYILRTWHPRTRPPRVELGETAWRGLEILATSHGQPADASGTVTFAAHFMGDAGNIGTMREHSHFELSGDTWLYVDGDVNEKGAA
jgi:SEC-C motif-containing protein